MANVHVEVLLACINSVATKLADNETIISIKQGMPMFSKNTQLPFLVDVATLDPSGQSTDKRRGIFALVTSNTPHKVDVHKGQIPATSWTPM